ncbi:MAG TPA: hypothetical protein VK177_20985 [Flavobacteriales bacterium]|nr:hypothetical protein [Flavobacteriales bacterium]
MAKTVICNQCGAADLIKVEESEYKCRYCHSRIVLEKPKLDLGNFIKTFNPTHVITPSQTAYTPDGQVVKRVSRLGCMIVVIIFMGILSGIIVPIIIAFSGRSGGTDSKTGSSDWKLSYTQQTFYATGSKGGVIWQLDDENYNYEKNRNVLSILDAKTKKVLYTEIYVKEHKSGETVASSWDLFNGGRVIGDTIFFTPKNGGLVARNIYTGKVIINNATFEKLLGEQIAEARAYINANTNEQDYLEVKSALGDEYYYYPAKNKFVKREEVRNTKETEKTAKYFFIATGSNDKKHVLRVNQKIAPYERVGFFMPGSYNEYKKQKQYYTHYHLVNSIDSIPAKNAFFDPAFITWDDTSFVIYYKENLLENSPRILARYGLSGKQLWKRIPTQEKPFSQLEKKEENPRFDILLINERLVISLNTGQKSAMEIDPANGKISWTYKSEK